MKFKFFLPILLFISIPSSVFAFDTGAYSGIPNNMPLDIAIYNNQQSTNEQNINQQMIEQSSVLNQIMLQESQNIGSDIDRNTSGINLENKSQFMFTQFMLQQLALQISNDFICKR